MSARWVKLDGSFRTPVLPDIHLLLPQDVAAPPPVASCGSFKDFCAFCGSSDRELQSCSGCARVRYCCKEHQQAAWSAGHKSTCGHALPKLVEVAAAKSSMALLRTLSEFGAAPSLEGLTQTALHRMGELADVSSVFMTTRPADDPCRHHRLRLEGYPCSPHSHRARRSRVSWTRRLPPTRIDPDATARRAGRYGLSESLGSRPPWPPVWAPAH